MAIGDTSNAGGTKAVELLASSTATNSPPSAASDGLELNELRLRRNNSHPTTATLVIASTAGSGTMTVTCRLWGYVAGADVWVPLGPGGDSTKGVINEGAAIGETGANTIRHAEPVDLPHHFRQLYLEITAIGGTATAVTAWLVFNEETD